MKSKNFLDKLKGKIVTIEHFSEGGIIRNNCILVEYDEKFLTLGSYRGAIFLLNLSYVISIHGANKESEKKFKSYVERYKKNKKFIGDTKVDTEKQAHPTYRYYG